MELTQGRQRRRGDRKRGAGRDQHVRGCHRLHVVQVGTLEHELLHAWPALSQLLHKVRVGKDIVTHGPPGQVGSEQCGIEPMNQLVRDLRANVASAQMPHNSNEGRVVITR